MLGRLSGIDIKIIFNLLFFFEETYFMVCSWEWSSRLFLFFKVYIALLLSAPPRHTPPTRKMFMGSRAWRGEARRRVCPAGQGVLRVLTGLQKAHPRNNTKSKEHSQLHSSLLHFLFGQFIHNSSSFARTKLLPALISRAMHTTARYWEKPASNELEMRCRHPRNFSAFVQVLDSNSKKCPREFLPHPDPDLRKRVRKCLPKILIDWKRWKQS